ALVAHPSQRAWFWLSQGEAYQVIPREVRIDWREEVLPGADEAARRRALVALEASERRKPFELDRPPLSRVVLVRDGHEVSRCWLVWTVNHLLLDGWATARWCAEVLERYTARVSGAPLAVAASPTYRNYLRWLGTRDHVEAERYFRALLAGFQTPTVLL